MKTIAFYNEKGGVGKTSFSIMYASWLKYKHGINVAIVDFNNRMENYRKDEIMQKKKLGVIDRYNLDDIWPIINADRKFIREFKKKNISPWPNATWLVKEIKTGSLNGCEVIILDFPGAAEGQEFMEILSNELITQLCIILDRDPQTIRTSMVIQNIAEHLKSTNTISYINQIQSYVSIHEYQEVARLLMSAKLKVLPDMISFTERMKKISEPDIMRSTLEYPDWNEKAFEGSRDLGLENLFIDVTKELDKTMDLKIANLKKADLSFVHDLEKTFQEKRQLVDSSFPEYEFPKEMFKKSRFKNIETEK